MPLVSETTVTQLLVLFTPMGRWFVVECIVFEHTALNFKNINIHEGTRWDIVLCYLLSHLSLRGVKNLNISPPLLQEYQMHSKVANIQE